MVLMFRLLISGAASKLMNGWAGANVPTGSVAFVRFIMVTVVPFRPAKLPVLPLPPILDWSGMNGESSPFHVIWVVVTLIVPPMLKTPDSGRALRFADSMPVNRIAGNSDVTLIRLGPPSFNFSNSCRKILYRLGPILMHKQCCCLLTFRHPSDCRWAIRASTYKHY